jgi:hypothetical protein
MISPIASRCRPDSSLRCAWRALVPHEALHYSHEAHGWVLWLGDVPTLVGVCPGCGGTLPRMGTNADTKQWLRDTLGNPDE